jgi:hypothetical protein
MTVEQAVQEFNLPSPRTIRTLRNQGLPTVKLGAARLIDYDDMVNFIERRKCQEETPARASAGSTAGKRSTSFGMSGAANDCGLLARQTSAELKKLSRRSSGRTSGLAEVRALPTR